MVATVGNGYAATPLGTAINRSRATTFGDVMAGINKGGASASDADQVSKPENTAWDAAADGIARLNDALAAFGKEASLTPAQRARRDVLKMMNLTEDAIKAMPPEQRKATEKKIAAEVARRLHLCQTSAAQHSSSCLDGAATDQSSLTA